MKSVGCIAVMAVMTVVMVVVVVVVVETAAEGLCSHEPCLLLCG